jgi:hypothetical protein
VHGTCSVSKANTDGELVHIHEEPEVSSPMPLDVAKNAAVVEIVANCI